MPRRSAANTNVRADIEPTIANTLRLRFVLTNLGTTMRDHAAP